jgi:hypothetical protein
MRSYRGILSNNELKTYKEGEILQRFVRTSRCFDPLAITSNNENNI